MDIFSHIFKFHIYFLFLLDFSNVQKCLNVIIDYDSQHGGQYLLRCHKVISVMGRKREKMINVFNFIYWQFFIFETLKNIKIKSPERWTSLKCFKLMSWEFKGQKGCETLIYLIHLNKFKTFDLCTLTVFKGLLRCFVSFFWI